MTAFSLPMLANPFFRLCRMQKSSLSVLFRKGCSIVSSSLQRKTHTTMRTSLRTYALRPPRARASRSAIVCRTAATLSLSPSARSRNFSSIPFRTIAASRSIKKMRRNGLRRIRILYFESLSKRTVLYFEPLPERTVLHFESLPERTVLYFESLPERTVLYFESLSERTVLPEIFADAVLVPCAP